MAEIIFRKFPHSWIIVSFAFPLVAWKYYLRLKLPLLFVQSNPHLYARVGRNYLFLYGLLFVRDVNSNVPTFRPSYCERFRRRMIARERAVFWRRSRLLWRNFSIFRRECFGWSTGKPDLSADKSVIGRSHGRPNDPGTTIRHVGKNKSIPALGLGSPALVWAMGWY